MAILSMSSIHIFLANKFIDEQHEEFELTKDEMTHGVVYALLFQNIRIRRGEPAGLKLTREGFKWLKNHYDCYKIKTNTEIVGKHILYLDRYLYYPYFIKNAFKADTEMYLFGAQDAIDLKLMEGNLDKWVEGRKTGERIDHEILENANITIH